MKIVTVKLTKLSRFDTPSSEWLMELWKTTKYSGEIKSSYVAPLATLEIILKAQSKSKNILSVFNEVK